MRKSKRIIFKSLVGFFAVILAIILVLPLFFKGTIQQKVKDIFDIRLEIEVNVI